MTRIPQDSPTEARRKELPRGDGNWPGYSAVYRNIAAGCEKMARAKYVYLSYEHIEQLRMRMRGWI